MESINLLISSVIQVMIFSVIPLIWWGVTARKKISFLKWLGIKKLEINDKKKYTITFVLTTLLLVVLSIIFPIILKDAQVTNVEVATSQFVGQGLSALIPALIFAFIQTGLSEEIVFRGFLLKRIANKFGFEVGNFIQSIVFGLMHGVFFIPMVGVARGLIIIILTGAIGWLMGWINEKQSGGSIISSWIIHGCANTIASLVAMFSLL